MLVKQVVLGANAVTKDSLLPLTSIAPQLVIAFGALPFFSEPGMADLLRRTFPEAALIGCSTAGEITRDGVNDGHCVITAVHFEGTHVRAATARLAGMADSQAAGTRIGRELAAPDLRAVLVFGPAWGRKQRD